MPLYSILAFIGVVPIFIASFLVFRYWKSKGAKELFFYCVSLGIWLFAAGVEDTSTTLSTTMLWAKIGYVGYVGNPVFLLLFLCNYSGIMKPVATGKIALLFILPIVTLVAAITNEYHKLLWTSVTMGESHSCLFEHGPWFYIFNAYLFICTLFSISLVVMMIIQRSETKQHGWLFMIGFSFQWWAGLLYIAKWNPFPGYDIVAMSGVFPSLMVIAGILFYSLFQQGAESSSSASGSEHKNDTTLLSEQEMILMNQLEVLLKEEKRYKSESFSLDDAANLLQTNRSYLSRAVNIFYSMRFSSLINSYRIEEFMKLAVESGDNLTIEALAKEVGFQQRSTFYKAFKSQKGTSPVAWLRKNRK